MKTSQTHPIEGVIYAIPERKVRGKKNPAEEYTFTSIILEVDTGYPPRPKSLPEFHIKRRNFDISGFEVGDPVEIIFTMSGEPIQSANPWHKTEAILISIRHLERNYNDSRAPDYTYKKPKEEQTEFPAEKDDDDGLPF